jgi:hypothetical protein
MRGLVACFVSVKGFKKSTSGTGDSSGAVVRFVGSIG